ncbi:sialate O-acetylesterase [Dyella sp.]|uniref:sialate O-acetylesterase n=1 Tax=Dyella sp. TaxID=1869338 RepID=UPI0039C8554C
MSQIKRRGAMAVLLVLVGVQAAQAADEQAPLLNPLFQDHVVLQRDQADPIWGHAKPREAVTLSFAGQDIHAQADANGRWHASLPAQSSGGPYTLTVTTAGGDTQTIHDVWVGDVWLCSGQSNMQLPVKRALDARAEVQDASNDRIRVLTVDDISSVKPLDSIPASDHWLKTTPNTVAEFSAACYFYARELQKDVPVPMGLIVAAWGGSRIEPWMSEAALRKVGGYDTSLDLLAEYRKDPTHAGQQWSRVWQAWWRSRPGIAKNDEPWNAADVTDNGWFAAPIDKGAWQHWGKPELANFTGMLWYRTTVTLTQAQAAQHAVLNFTANEIDQTWVNGRWVGTGYGNGDVRGYAIPSGVLHVGKNLIAVNVLNTYRDGGIYGPASQHVLHLGDGSNVPLDAWQYKVVPLAYGPPPNVPWQSTSGLTTLYNGMIAPLGHYGLRGELWYQGESNTGDAASYRKLLEAWRADERTRFGANLPILIAQLSSYGPSPTHPSESGWADVREAQRVVAAEDPHSALAVSVDIGERYDIHPANKQELGRRLARAARHVIYGEALPPSGPTPASAQQNGDTVMLTFNDVTGQLVAYSADNPIGFELCGDQPGSCHYALADIRGNQVVLHAQASAQNITRVRYCWADSPICTLFDQAGMPAGPFQLTITSTH